MRITIGKSLKAGLMIGLGCIACLSVAQISSVLGAVLFSLGLITVSMRGYFLYTGQVGYLGWSVAGWVLLLGMVVLNLVSIGVLASISGFDCSGIIGTKLNETWVEALLRSMGCGAMMFIAVDGYRKLNRNLLAIILPVVVFILCGFDHCIANYFYMVSEGIYFDWHLLIWIAGNALGAMTIASGEDLEITAN